MPEKVIAVLGMPGAGKSEAVSFLVERYGIPRVYFGQVTLDEIARRGLLLNPENEKMVREGLRDQYGEDHYANKIIEKIDELGDSSFVLADGLYSWAEYQVFRERFGDSLLLLTIHAAPKIRYERLRNRPRRPLTESEARDRDEAELNRFLKGNPIALSDVIIVNEWSLEVFHKELEEFGDRYCK